MKTTSLFTTLVGAAVLTLPVLAFGQMAQDKKHTTPAKQQHARSSETTKAPTTEPTAPPRGHSSHQATQTMTEGKSMMDGNRTSHSQAMKHTATSERALKTTEGAKTHETSMKHSTTHTKKAEKHSATASTAQGEQKPTPKPKSPGQSR